MKCMISVLLLASLLVSCEKIEGQLNVTKDIKLQAANSGKHLIRIGTYTADIKANTSKKVTLRLNNDNNEKFNFTLPDHAKIPDNGTISFTSKQIGQPADLKVAMKTDVTNGPTQEAYLSCIYQIPVRVCSPDPRIGCTIQYQTMYGHQWARFYDQTVSKDVTLCLTEPNATEDSASFVGNLTTTNRIVISESPCR